MTQYNEKITPNQQKLMLALHDLCMFSPCSKDLPCFFGGGVGGVG